MLRTVKAMKGFSIGAKDGDIGETVDFIFDDKAWTIRYVVVDTGKWLSGRRVLISPIVVGPADWENKRIPVLLNQEQVKNSPDISLNEELSQQDEIKYYDHFGWPYYWMGDDIWGPASVPTELALEGIERQKVLTESINQSHLRSAQEVIDYSIKSTGTATSAGSATLSPMIRNGQSVTSLSTPGPGGPARKSWLRRSGLLTWTGEIPTST